MGFPAREHQNCQSQCLAEPDEDGVLKREIRVVERVDGWCLYGTQQSKLTTVTTYISGKRQHHFVDDMKRLVVIVHEKSEHRIIGTAELTDPDWEPVRRKCSEGCCSFGGTARTRDGDLVEVARRVEADCCSHDCDRATDEPCNGG